MKKKNLSLRDMDRVCGEAVGLLKSLAHPHRLRLLCLLAEGERTVGGLQKACGASQSVVSQFLGRLKREGVIVSRKEGQRVWYKIQDFRVVALVRALQKVFCVGLLLWGAAGAVRSETTMAEVVAAVVARAPAVRAAQAQVPAARWAQSEARAARGPRVDWRASWTRSDQPVFVFGSLLGQETFGPSNFAVDSLNRPSLWSDVRNSLDVGVPLWMAGDLVFREKMARQDLRASELQQTGAEQSTRFQAVTAVLNLLRAEELESLWSARYRSASKEVEDARLLRKRGVVLGSDFFAAEALVRVFQAQRTGAQNDLQSAKDALAVLLGRPDFEDSISGSLQTKGYFLEPLEIYLSRASAARPDLSTAEARLAQSRMMADQSARGLWPRVEAFASVETHTRDFETNPSQKTVGVRSVVSFLDPGRRARRNQALEGAAAAQWQWEGTREAVRREVTAAYRALEGIQAQRVWIQEAVEQARTSLELVRPLYREGRQSLLDVVRAEEALGRLQAQAVDLVYAVHRGYAGLEAAAGGLEPPVVQTIQSQWEARP